MKINRLQHLRTGFTLIELLVAMAITVVLLGVLVYMTGVSMDTYRDSRNEVRASRQAKEALETIAKDLESMVSRRDGNAYEWLYAGVDSESGTSDSTGPTGKDGQITNRAQLLFFTSATDRYNGNVGVVGEDDGGDVSAVSYRLVFRDQIGDTDDEKHAVFSFYRHLVNPDETFGVDSNPGLLAVDDLQSTYQTNFASDGLAAANFLVENVYEFTVTFLVEYVDDNGTPNDAADDFNQIERVTLMQDDSGGYQEFRLKGNKVEAIGPNSTEIEQGSIVGVEVSITVLTDRGLALAKKSGISREDLVKKHSYHYSKLITTPRP
ncbi:MAG: prepilin-type N-terminal cleavage/methylation domain-containing protein [Verrucomicrobiae bacterium]|nr:prepilin-type N-terminal cleavage/methylation domain-containing protein [Verrucomicrobiae bacterium]NNJ43579.1 prepilin-type N-terminal cleavage/methylation domain-containing protein [Akkermansiaceae bacterium]